MKKIVCLLLVVLMAVCSVVYAEGGFDLSSMSLDELVALHKAVDAEIDSRIGCEPDTIPAGVYVGGESIKAGKYVVSADDDHFGITVGVFASKDIYDKALAEQDESLISFQNYLSSGDSAFVQIDDGMVLLLSDTALIEEASGVWMP